VGAVDADLAGIHVEPASDHHPVPGGGRDPGRQADVVVDLEQVSRPRADLQPLVSLGVDGAGEQIGVERDLGPVVTLDDRLVEATVVGLGDRGVGGLFPTAPEREQRA
jgi:hypothetical protein